MTAVAPLAAQPAPLLRCKHRRDQGFVLALVSEKTGYPAEVRT